MSIKVSVVVPVYNVEQYLARSLSSLVGQTLGEIEVIVVNDGSPDGSQAIIDDFSKRFPDKIVALRQENKGPGIARNLGIERARGEYIGFCDPDDLALPDMFRLMYEAAKADNSDVVICDYMDVYEYEYKYKTREYPGWPDKTGVAEDVAGFVFYSTNAAFVWNKLFRPELLRSAPFPAGCYEDVATIPVILSNCGKISYLRKVLYHYSRRLNSITTQTSGSANLDVVGAWRRCLDECNPRHIKEMEYAVYYSISRFLEYRKDCFEAYTGFFDEFKPRFQANELISKEIFLGRVRDLFSDGAATAGGAGAGGADVSASGAGALNTYEQSIQEFLEQTAPLCEQLEALPPETAKELHDMYDAVIQMAEAHEGEIEPGLPDVLRKWQSIIGERI